MKRLAQLFSILFVLLAAQRSQGFSLLGPFPPWQLASYSGFTLTYTPGGSIGGPMTLQEYFRWNIPEVTYAFDQSFIRYFGLTGIREVEKAVKILNDLPPASRITNDTTQLFIRGEPVPMDTRRVNYQARALGLRDLKSTALTFLLEEMGLGAPERWVYSLRGRDVIANVLTNWTTVVFNYDPITLRPTNRINSVFYTYTIFEAGGVNLSEAVEFPEFPLQVFEGSSVAGAFDGSFLATTFFPILGAGEFFTGLTHDDVGGLRYLLDPNNIINENFLPGTVVQAVSRSGSGNSPWSPVFGGTNGIGTNITGTTNISGVITQALQGGVDKIRLRRVNFDSLLGQTFTPIRQDFGYTIVTNGRVFRVTAQRTVTQPDIVFGVGDLGVAGAFPFFLSRTATAAWQTNALNSSVAFAERAGPGIIVPRVEIIFTDKLPYYFNSNPGSPDRDGGTRSLAWGSFDATTNEPIVYPFGRVSLDDIRRELGVSGGQ